jgi:branched-subunit amino acid ABC-type transport system permease component
MCARLSDDWLADPNRKRRIHLFGPVAWYVAVALSAAAVISFFAAYLVILFGLGGRDAWPVLAIVLASIGFVIAVPAALAWLSRKTRVAERVSRHSVPDQTEHTDAWLGSLAPHGDLPQALEGQREAETDYRVKRTRYQWIMVLAFILVVLVLVLFFRSLWIPDFGMP